MNSFLKKQLDNKLKKFLEGKSDAFVIELNKWLSFGDGPLSGPPSESVVSKEDFEYFVKEIVGETALANLVSDMEKRPEFFSKLSGTEKAHLAYLNNELLVECYFRLMKRVHEDKMAEINRAAEAHKEKLKKTCADLRESLLNVAKASPEAKEDAEKVLAMLNEAECTGDYFHFKSGFNSQSEQEVAFEKLINHLKQIHGLAAQ